MAFADPQSVTINAVPVSLPRTSSGVNTGSFTKDDGNVKLTMTHVFGRRNRSTLRLDQTKVAPDPLISSTNVIYGISVILSIDSPKTGFTLAEKKYVVDALTAYLTASSGARATQLLGGES